MIETNRLYWDCECKTNYQHKKIYETESRCYKCHTYEYNGPDSRVNELLALKNICPDCSGTGHQEFFMDDDPTPFWNDEERCKTCKGFGQVPYKPNLRVTICLDYEGISDPNSTKADEIVELLGEETTKGEWFGAKMCWIDEIEIVNEVSHE